MFKFTEVGICKQSVAEQIKESNAKTEKKEIKGDLLIFIEVATGMLLLKMGMFEYGINPNDQILYEDKDPHFKLVLCLDSHSEDTWILKINNNVQLIYLVLSERCKLIHQRASRIILQEMKQSGYPVLQNQEVKVETNYYQYRDISDSIQKNTVNVNVNNQNKNLQNNVNNQNLQNNINNNQQQLDPTTQTLINASKSLSKGLAYAGKLLAKGFETLGAFLAKKVQPEQAIHISEDSKKLINNSVDGSKKVLELTSQKLAQLFRMAKKQVIQLSERLEKTEKGQNMIKEGNYKQYKKKFLTGLHLIGNVYEGFTQGISEATTGLAKGTTNVVGAKYGEHAQQASLQAFEGGRNVMRILDAPKNIAKQEFKPTESAIKRL